MTMRVEVESETPLWFGPGSPVRAASAICAFGDGWLIAQDDATHAAWLRPDGVTAVRVSEPVEGHDTFGSGKGTCLGFPPRVGSASIGRPSSLRESRVPPATAAGISSTAPSGIRKHAKTATPKPSASGRSPRRTARRCRSRRPRRWNGTPVSSTASSQPPIAPPTTGTTV